MPKAKELKYLWVLLTSDGKWSVRRTGGMVQRQQFCRRYTSLHRGQEEAQPKGNALIHQSIFLPALTHRHEL